MRRRRGREAKPRLSRETAEAAWRRDEIGGWVYCVCGCGQPKERWHHIFDQHAYPGLADEVANIVPIADHCHIRHHNAYARLPRSVCKYAEALVTTPQMERYLERLYWR